MEVSNKRARADCPYLDTVNRGLLDFDFEKVCSVTLQNLNVYACLVCGKYFQGRSRETPAFIHSLQEEHHVFIHLDKKVIYCLPDGYVVDDASLKDIVYLLDPTYTPEEIAALDTDASPSVTLDGKSYVPGIVGLNDIKKCDSLNGSLLALAHVRELRNFFLLPSNYQPRSRSALVKAFGEFVRKVWNRRNFKPHVSPHEILQAVSEVSKKRFSIGQQADPVQFLAWFLNALHEDLRTDEVFVPGDKKKRTIIHWVFQGQLEWRAEKDVRTDAQKEAGEAPVIETTQGVSKFLFLSLDLPPAPLFKDEQLKNIIPQIPLMVLLEKFDGQQWTEIPVELTRKTFNIVKLPPVLVVVIKRFSKNRFTFEKNPTIVTFPVKNLDLAPYVKGSTAPIKYDLLASIRHEGPPVDGRYGLSLLSQCLGEWYDIDNLHVRETQPQKVALSEAYIQFYKKGN